MTLEDRIRNIQSRLPGTMLRHRDLFARRLANIRRNSRGRDSDRGLLRQLTGLEESVEASALEMEKRRLAMPGLTYPEELPITPRLEHIVRTIEEHQVVIISGETGSGKSTQIPKMCLQAGRGIAGKIGCTQPRRIAATTIAHRIAEELGEEIGRSIGYKIRFRDRTPPDAYIKIMTDGMLLAETQADPRLLEYDTLIIDEAHERSLNIDFLLGIAKTLLAKRPELKLVITSATLDTEKFSAAFGNAPVVEVGGRMYPVELEYLPVDPMLEEEGDTTYVDMAVRAVDRLRHQRRFGDVLIFMPTEQDILETCERIEGHRYTGVTVLPLFARLPGSQQARVYSVTGSKIVVATNVAETSLTIPGIRYVIDTGLARVSQYLSRTRTTSIPISPISRSSADQRKGRCGRVQNGVCIRLYSEEDYEARPAFTVPEILRSNLAEVILRMIFLNLGHPASFPFVDPPGARSIKDGYDLLLELGAIVREGRDYRLTDKGRVMARMPLDPRISRMMLEASREGCVRDVAVIAAALSIQDPRERPVDKAAQADQVHAPFRDQDSDFLTLRNIWMRYHRSWDSLKTQNRMRKFCRENFLSFPRMREWVYIHEQILTILREQKIRIGKSEEEKETPQSRYAAIHRSILSGFLSNIAIKKEKNIYTAARGREAMIFPGSTLFNRKAPWIVAAEMVKTSRLFARTAARVDPDWLEALGGDLCRYSYSEPHWEKNRGEVRALEQVTLYGLVIVPGRAVSYGPVNPEEAHEIFVRSALVEGEVRERLPFLDHNLKLIGKFVDMEDKVRRRDVLVSDEVLADFYSLRLKGVYDIRTLKKMIRDRTGDDFLRLKEEDIILALPEKEEIALYPDELAIGEARFKTAYRFAPGREDDGVTVRIPASLASRIPAEHLEWGVPGQLREKMTALIKGLPKRYRKQLVPVSGTVETMIREMEPDNGSLISSMAGFIYRRFGVDIPASVWAGVEIPEHLKMRIALTDHRGREVEAGRDIRILGRGDKAAHPEADSDAWKKARRDWEKENLTTWDFGTLPESIDLGPHLAAHPGLEPADGGVNIRLFTTHEEALEVHKKGVQSLLSLCLSKDIKFLKRNWTLTGEGARGASYFGGTSAVEKSMHRSILKSLFRKDIRDPEAFRTRVEFLKTAMFERAKELRGHALRVLESYRLTRFAIHTLEGANSANRAVLELCAAIRKDLDVLVPPDFLETYDPERLSHIPRYLRAMEIRAGRGANDPEKDRVKAAQVEVFIEALAKMKGDMSAHASLEKREAIEDFRWMIEEFRVSLFAQELKTLFPVSTKRLEERRKEIERMI